MKLPKLDVWEIAFIVALLLVLGGLLLTFVMWRHDCGEASQIARTSADSIKVIFECGDVK